MQVARATPADAQAVAQIHVSAWQAAYEGIVPTDYLAGLSVPAREAYWGEAIRAGHPELWVARVGGEMAGWVALGPCRDEGCGPAAGEIWAIYVAAPFWSQGVGKALWLRARDRLIEREFSTASLWVLAENARAIRFYAAAGFAPEPGSAKTFELGGKSLEEIRYVAAIGG
jgi:ribosomal protein S18 acetylase RimI-like enzyme